MVVLVLGLEVPMNHIGIEYEGTIGTSVRSFDGMNDGKIPVGSFPENLLNIIPDTKMVGSGCGP